MGGGGGGERNNHLQMKENQIALILIKNKHI